MCKGERIWGFSSRKNGLFEWNDNLFSFNVR